MTTIRRIYVYLLAFAGLAMVSLAAANLVQLLVDLGLHSSAVSTDRYVRDTVSLYAAAALVGLPVWLVHWLWIARSVRSDPQERASTLRRLYLYAVLVGATLEIAGSARDALFSAFAALVGAPHPHPRRHRSAPAVHVDRPGRVVRPLAHRRHRSSPGW